MPRVIMWCLVIQHNDTQHNGFQHISTQHNKEKCTAECLNLVYSAVMSLSSGLYYKTITIVNDDLK
jgi:hypothetical protein